MPTLIPALFKRLGNARALSLALPIALLLALALSAPPLINRLDLLSYDLLAQRLGPVTPATNSVVIAIDDADLARLGNLPLSRSVHAELLARLRHSEAGSISFAILMDKPGTDREGDQALAEQIALADAVIMPVIPAPGSPDNGPAALRALDRFRIAVTEGHVDVEIDPDGVSRRLYLSAGTEGQWWPPLALAALLRQSNWSAILPGGRMAPEPTNGLDRHLWQRDRELLLRNDLIGPIQVFSLGSVLDHAVPASALRDKAVFIGVTASGANSGLSMANSRKGVLVPAVEYHARVFEALAVGAVITPMSPGASLQLEIALLLLAGFVCCGLPGNRNKLSLLLLCAIPAGVSFALIHLMGLWFPPVAAGLAMCLLISISLWRQVSRFESDTAVLSVQTKVAMESIADGVIVIDSAGRIEQINGVATRMLRAPEASLPGSICAELLGGLPVSNAIRDCLAANQPAVLEEAVTLQGDPPCTVRISIGPVATEDGRRRGAVLVLSDVTPLIAAEKLLKYQATHDDLTGLPNRTLVQDRLQQQLSGLQRRGVNLVVLFLDLDRFKRINDGAGHQVGDEILRAVGRRLTAACRADDTVGRWGGDEFVVLLSGDAKPTDIEIICRKLIDTISEAIVVDGISFHVGASIGIAVAPADSQLPEEMVRLADLAMYRAKMGGGNRFAFASTDMNRSSAQRLEIEVGLRKALQKNEFEIHYQPQISIAAQQLTGLEALIRWRRPGIGVLQPDQFIPIAEESELINEIGRWVLDEVGRQLAEWRAAGCAVVPVAVNVSARQCQSSSLVDEVRQMLERHAIPADLIEIEITETAAVENLEQVTQLLNELSQLGIRLAMDDFGTGYSSLAHLKSLPISILKIDKSFVGGTPGNHEDSSISRATIALAHSLGMTVVAEGVENEQQRAFLDRERCDVAQGFLFDRPIHASKMLLLLRHATFAPARSLAAT